MARISTYERDNTINPGDEVIGTDVVDNGTKNFTIDRLTAYFEQTITAATDPNDITSATFTKSGNTVTLTLNRTSGNPFVANFLATEGDGAIHTGTGDPVVGQINGLAGDFYFQVDTTQDPIIFNTYGPLTQSTSSGGFAAWNAVGPNTLVGPQGEMGDQGFQGVSIDDDNYVAPTNTVLGTPTTVTIPLEDPSSLTTPTPITFAIPSGIQGEEGDAGHTLVISDFQQGTDTTPTTFDLVTNEGLPNQITQPFSISPGVQGIQGDGWTSVTYAPLTGFLTFASDDGLEFTTPDIRGEQGFGYTGATYDPTTGFVTFASATPALELTTSDIRGAQGEQGELENQRDNSDFFFWEGTLAQYNAIGAGNYRDDFVYNVTDDFVEGALIANPEDRVVANPSDPSTANLDRIRVDDVIYGLGSGAADVIATTGAESVSDGGDTITVVTRDTDQTITSDKIISGQLTSSGTTVFTTPTAGDATTTVATTAFVDRDFEKKISGTNQVAYATEISGLPTLGALAAQDNLTAAQVTALNIPAAGDFLPLTAGSANPITGALHLENGNTEVVMEGNTSGNLNIVNETGTIALRANGSSVNSAVVSSTSITLNEPTTINGGGSVPLNVDSTQDFLIGLNRNGTFEWFLNAYADGRFALHENGVGDQFTILAGGNVGVGTITPDSKLHVRGDNVKLEGDAIADPVSLSFNQGNAASINSDVNYANIVSTVTDGNTGFESSELSFQTRLSGTTTEKMRIHSTGDISTAANSHTPYIQLVDSGRTAVSPGYTFNNDVNTGMFQPSGSGDTIAFSTAGVERMRIDSGGDATFTGEINITDGTTTATITPTSVLSDTNTQLTEAQVRAFADQAYVRSVQDAPIPNTDTQLTQAEVRSLQNPPIANTDTQLTASTILAVLNGASGEIDGDLLNNAVDANEVVRNTTGFTAEYNKLYVLDTITTGGGTDQIVTLPAITAGTDGQKVTLTNYNGGDNSIANWALTSQSANISAGLRHGELLANTQTYLVDHRDSSTITLTAFFNGGSPLWILVDDERTADAIINDNSQFHPTRVWTGTLAEYEALATPRDSFTLFFTNDT